MEGIEGKIDNLSLDQSANMPSSHAPSAEAAAPKKLPIVLIVLGMAGSGKTTFVQVFRSYEAVGKLILIVETCE